MRNLALTALILVSSSSFAASNSISPQCLSRVKMYSTSIENAAIANLNNFDDSKAEEEVLSSAEQREEAKENALYGAVQKLKQGNELVIEDMSILGVVCNLRTFDSDSVGLALESLGN